MWTASTERFNKGTWKTIDELFLAIKNNDPEISPSIIFAAAAIVEGCIFINGSPQNTIGESILSLAKKHNTFVAGEDFKTGQTKLKSVLVDFLASSGIKPLSIVSYNHLGNNDGYNLNEQPQFESKEITKRNVIDDIVDENKVLFNNKKPEHCVVIKYIEAVGDSKRAMDEYYSELFLDGRSTISIHNICEDTLLAVPLMLDIILFAEFFSRISFTLKNKTTVPFASNLSLLSLFFKAPVDDNNPIINSFFKQRYALENFIKASIGLPINDFININNRL
jgi:myo-inositol-1-phosphate synthase